MVAAVVRAVASKKRFVRVPASLVPAAGDMRLSSKVTAKGEAGVKKKKALLPKKKRSAAGASGTKKKASPRSVRTKKAVPKKKAPKSAVKKLKKPTIVREPPQQPPPHHRPVMQVYVLELEGGHVYVGKSSDVKLRVGQHMAGAGSAFTKAHRPTGRLLPRLGTLVGDGDGPERDETLRQMLRHGARCELNFLLNLHALPKKLTPGPAPHIDASAAGDTALPRTIPRPTCETSRQTSGSSWTCAGGAVGRDTLLRGVGLQQIGWGQ